MTKNTEIYLCVRACVVCVFVVHTIAYEGWKTVCGAVPQLPPCSFLFFFSVFFFMTGSLCVAHYPWNEWLLSRLPSLPLDWNPSETLNQDKPSFSCLPGRYFRHSNTKWNKCSQWGWNAGKSPWEICCVEGLEVPDVLASLWASPVGSSTVCSISVEGSRQWA